MKVLTDVNANNQLHTNTQLTIHKACNIAMRYKFSFYDTLIIAAALESNCTILYSEDMHHNQVIENALKIVNPFV
jgi:predicted nucleic acid-binding protein